MLAPHCIIHRPYPRQCHTGGQAAVHTAVEALFAGSVHRFPIDSLPVNRSGAGGATTLDVGAKEAIGRTPCTQRSPR